MNSTFLRISATVNALRIVATMLRDPDDYGSRMTQVPPAASIASRAFPLKPWA